VIKKAFVLIEKIFLIRNSALPIKKLIRFRSNLYNFFHFSCLKDDGSEFGNRGDFKYGWEYKNEGIECNDNIPNDSDKMSE
jgi:hypothetical protein